MLLSGEVIVIQLHCPVKGVRDSKDRIHKWLPIQNYFVSIKISQLTLFLSWYLKKTFYSQMRLVGLIQIRTKEL